MLILSTIIQFVLLAVSAQRLAAQALGRLRFVITILAGILQSQSSVLSLSLGQSLPPRVLAGVACSYVLGGVIF